MLPRSAQCVGQAQEICLFRAAPGLLRRLDGGLGIARDGGEVSRLRIDVGKQLVELRRVAAQLLGLLRPFAGLVPVLDLRVKVGELLGRLRLLGRAELARGHGRLERLDGGLRLACARRRGPAHAVHRQLLGGCLVGDRIGLAHFRQRLLGAAGLEIVRRLLQGLANLRTQLRIGKVGAGRQRERHQESGSTASSTLSADELLVAYEPEFRHAEALR